MAKILLVEDDNNLREIFEMRLQAEGYQTVTAADGEEALAVAMKERPDLIIADVMMPKLSGFEMLETLRAAPEMSSVKVIMMTALGQAEDRTRGEKLGVVKYLVKSQVTLEDFVRVVREVIPPAQADAGVAPASAMDSANASVTTNKVESEQAMQDDQQQSNPTPDAGAGAPTNPISGDAGATDASGQMSASEEQSQVDEKVNDFAGGAPSVPSSDSGSSFGGDNAGTSTPGGDVPASSPPASDPAPAGGTEDGDSSNPTGPPPAPGGGSQV